VLNLSETQLKRRPWDFVVFAGYLRVAAKATPQQSLSGLLSLCPSEIQRKADLMRELQWFWAVTALLMPQDTSVDWTR
jgi:hypothetical protein